MIRRPPRSTRTDTLFPYTTLFRSETLLAALAAGEEWDRIHDRTPAGAARNAVDCAVWDLRAKRSGRSVAALMGQPEPVPVPTTYTLGLDSPVAMAAAAKVAGAAHGPLNNQQTGRDHGYTHVTHA